MGDNAAHGPHRATQEAYGRRQFTALYCALERDRVSTQHSRQSKFYPIRPKQTHTFSCWAKASAPSTKLRLSMNSGYVADGRGVQGHSREFEVATHWQRLSVTGVLLPAPAKAYFAQVRLAGNTRGRVWIDGLQLEEGPGSAYSPARAVTGVLRTSHRPSDLYTWEEPVEVKVHVVNQTDQPAASNLRWRVEDFWGKTVASGRLASELEGGERRAMPIPLLASLRGSCHLLVEEGPTIVSETTLTVVPPPRHAGCCRASRFGGHMGYAPYAYETAKRLGVLTVGQDVVYIRCRVSRSTR